MSITAFIAIDKPAGITSFDVIRRLRKITGIRKIGHTGTLDPFATGLLICCIGAYTRLASFVEAEDKRYFATVQLGQKSSTGDPEGIIEAVDFPQTDYSLVKPAMKQPILGWQSPDCHEPIGRSAHLCLTRHYNFSEIEQKAVALSELPIPIYSAVKIDGTRAYKLARSGEEVIIPPRRVRISEFKFATWPDGSVINSAMQFHFNCRVSKGTYIRSLSQWLARQMGTEGYTIQLRREAIGSVDISQAVKLEDLSPENWQNSILDPQNVLTQLQSYELTDTEYASVCNGGDFTPEDNVPETMLALYYKSQLVAIGQSSEEQIHPKIVLT